MEILDILILGSGPAALCLASELAKQDLNIKGISTKSPNEKWENTYGICCLLYTSPSPRDVEESRMPSSA